MPNSKTSKASYVSKTCRVTLEKYKILNRDSRKKLKTEKLKTQEKNLKTREKNLKTQAKNSRIRHFFVPFMPKKWLKNSLC